MDCRFAAQLYRYLKRLKLHGVTSRDYLRSKSSNTTRTVISSKMRRENGGERKRKKGSGENYGGWGDGSKLRWA